MWIPAIGILLFGIGFFALVRETIKRPTALKWGISILFAIVYIIGIVWALKQFVN